MRGGPFPHLPWAVLPLGLLAFGIALNSAAAYLAGAGALSRATRRLVADAGLLVFRRYCNCLRVDFTDRFGTPLTLSVAAFAVNALGFAL